MSAEEQLFYIGVAAYLLPPALILAVVARYLRRSFAWTAFALLGWLGLALGLFLLTVIRPDRGNPAG